MHARIIILRSQLFGSDIFRNRQHTFISIFKLLSKWVNSCVVWIIPWHILSRTYMLHIPSYWAPTSSALKDQEQCLWDAVVHPQRENHELLSCPCQLNSEFFGTTSNFLAHFCEVYPRRRTSVNVVYCQSTDKLFYYSILNTHNTCTFGLALTHVTVKTILKMGISCWS